MILTHWHASLQQQPPPTQQCPTLSLRPPAEFAETQVLYARGFGLSWWVASSLTSRHHWVHCHWASTTTFTLGMWTGGHSTALLTSCPAGESGNHWTPRRSNPQVHLATTTANCETRFNTDVGRSQFQHQDRNDWKYDVISFWIMEMTMTLDNRQQQHLGNQMVARVAARVAAKGRAKAGTRQGARVSARNAAKTRGFAGETWTKEESRQNAAKVAAKIAALETLQRRGQR